LGKKRQANIIWGTAMKQVAILLVVFCVAASGCSHFMPSMAGDVRAPVVTMKTSAVPEVEVATTAPSAVPALERQPLRTDMDADNDGVADAIDECPASPAAVAVDSFGCPVSLYLHTKVTFHAGEVVASERIKDQVERIGYVLQQNPESTVQVAGHTDNSGDSAANLQLSKQRAQSIKQLLMLLYDIDPSRITVTGHGEARPLVSNATEEGRQRNRRVELTLRGYYRDTTSYIALNRPYNIHFETGQSMISGRFKEQIDKLGAYLNQNLGTRVRIDGYTDNVGNAEANLHLSKERADAVRQYLAKNYGIAPERLLVEGHGEQSPLASNDTEAGRFKNRRVTITVSRSAAQPVQQAQTYSSRLDTNGRIDTATYTPLGQNLTLQFRADATELDLSTASKVNEIGLMLQKKPDLQVTISGHASSGGSDHQNQQLSRQRAENVKRYLQARYDIAPERLHVVGQPDTPLADASSPEAVQIKLTQF